MDKLSKHRVSSEREHERAIETLERDHAAQLASVASDQQAAQRCCDDAARQLCTLQNQAERQARLLRGPLAQGAAR